MKNKITHEIIPADVIAEIAASVPNRNTIQPKMNIVQTSIPAAVIKIALICFPFLFLIIKLHQLIYYHYIVSGEFNILLMINWLLSKDSEYQLCHYKII